ncbi:MAG: hypothetical protein ACLUD2_05410 [Clostridium sp.]
MFLAGYRLCGIKLRGLDLTPEDIIGQLDLIDRGFDDIEHRICNMDTEHTGISGYGDQT